MLGQCVLKPCFDDIYDIVGYNGDTMGNITSKMVYGRI